MVKSPLLLDYFLPNDSAFVAVDLFPALVEALTEFNLFCNFTLTWDKVADELINNIQQQQMREYNIQYILQHVYRVLSGMSSLAQMTMNLNTAPGEYGRRFTRKGRGEEDAAVSH